MLSPDLVRKMDNKGGELAPPSFNHRLMGAGSAESLVGMVSNVAKKSNKKNQCSNVFTSSIIYVILL